MPNTVTIHHYFDEWSDVEAIAGTVNGLDVAIYYDAIADSIHIFFKPDDNDLSYEYLIQFPDNNNPIDAGSDVVINRYLWDLKTVNPPVLQNTGVATVVL